MTDFNEFFDQEFSNESSHGFAPEKVKCFSKKCGAVFNFLEGTIIFKCPNCTKMNCYECKMVHAEGFCPKMMPERNMRTRLGKRRSEETSEEVSESGSSSSVEEHSEDRPRKKARVSSPVTVTYDCHLCDYQSMVKSSFTRHENTIKHASALRGWKKKAKK